MKKWLFITLALMVWTATAAQSAMGVPVATEVEKVNVKLLPPHPGGAHSLQGGGRCGGRFSVESSL